MIPKIILKDAQERFGEKLVLPAGSDRRLKASFAWQGSESQLQKAYFAHIAKLAIDSPILHLAHAIPNGGSRDIITASNLKAEGVKSGVPDVFIPIPNEIYHGLYIEFKRAGGSPSQAQRVFMNYLDEVGYKCLVINCLDYAILETKNYLKTFKYVRLED